MRGTRLTFLSRKKSKQKKATLKIIIYFLVLKFFGGDVSERTLRVVKRGKRSGSVRRLTSKRVCDGRADKRNRFLGELSFKKVP